jgi:hypothetical protein
MEVIGFKQTVITKSIVMDPKVEYAINFVSLGLSFYQLRENQKTVKLLKRIHRQGYKTVLRSKPPIKLMK